MAYVLSPRVRRIARTLLWVVICAVPLVAQAQFIDTIDVDPAGTEVEIRVRFVTNVQLLRHSPQDKGQLLRIELQLLGPVEDYGGRTLLETYTPPVRGLLLPFTVSFADAGKVLNVSFARSVRFRVRPGPDARSVIIYVARDDVPESPAAAPLPPRDPVESASAPKSEPPVVPKPESMPATEPPQVSLQPPPGDAQPGVPVPDGAVMALNPEELLRQGRAALQRNDPQQAIEALNQLLNLPPNAYSQEAQELAGLARERNGELAKARAEYELYLKLYPDSEGAQRVAKRMAQLPVPVAGRGVRTPARPIVTEYSLSGGVSQFYYRGSTKYDATLAPPVPGLKFDQISLTGVDQSSLVTNIDLTWRIRSPGADSKFVMRDILTNNYLPGQDDTNRLYAMYYEHQAADASYLGRLGRQPGYTGGMLGRFDGAWAGYTVKPGLRLNAVVGSPVEFYAAQPKHFVGINTDIGPVAERWNGNLFFVQQESEGVLDRRAVGGELRYFDARANLFSLVDYDLAFNALNIAMVQGSVTLESGATWTLLLDHRRVPVLQTTNVLIGETATIPGLQSPSLPQLVQAGRTEADLRAGAMALTPVSDLFLIGYTRPVTPTLQLGGDFRISSVSETSASGNLPAAPGTGNVYVYTGQAIKTGVFTERDTGVVSLSLIDGMTYNGQSLSVNHVFLKDLWRVESALRMYRQLNNQGVRLARIAPTLRLSYRVRNHLNLEMELGVERTTTDGPTQTDKTDRQFFNLGYRWDLY